LTVEVEKGAFDKKLPVVAAENPTVRIERRLFQVFHNILLVNFIRLEFCFKFHFLFLGGFGFWKPPCGGRRFPKGWPASPDFFLHREKVGGRRLPSGHLRPGALCAKRGVRPPQNAGFETPNSQTNH
jgi:hypothetical protein